MIPTQIPQAHRASDSNAVRRDLLHWSIATDRGAHTLDIVPAFVGRGASIEVDGVGVLRIPKPSVQRPWSEGEILVDGAGIIIALIWHDLVMHTDVFQDGVSLVDGRSVSQAREAPPAPIAGYERWFRTNFTLTRGSLTPRWTAALMLSGFVALVVIALSHASGTIAGSIALIGCWAMIIAWVWYWLAFTVTVHRRLLRRPRDGDFMRAGILASSFLAFPLFTLGLAALCFLAIQRLSQSL